MGMWTKWNLGGKALQVASWAADVARSIDPGAVLAIAFKVVEIQRDHADKPGAARLNILLAWVRAEYQLSDNVATVIGYVNSLYALLKAVEVIKSVKGGK